MHRAALAVLCAVTAASAVSVSTASNNFSIGLTPPLAPGGLTIDSPFGINTAFNPDTPDLDCKLAAMQEAGIKWGRQDFTWRRIEKTQGEYNWSDTTRSVPMFSPAYLPTMRSRRTRL